jgi:hypothetical protein
MAPSTKPLCVVLEHLLEFLERFGAPTPYTCRPKRLPVAPAERPRIRLGGQLKTGNLWTGQNRQFLRPAETSKFYFVPSSVRKSVCTVVRQLRGPHFSTRSAADPVRTAYCDAGLRLIGGTMPTAR